MKYANTFSPCKIGSLELRNRLIVPAMETEYSHDGTINARIRDYWIERAKGGWALLTVEVAAVSQDGKGFPNSLTLYNDDCIDMYRKLTDAVHEYGAKMSIQLHHAGRQTLSAFTGTRPVAPSAIANPLYGEVPRELTTEECWRIINDYGEAALRAKKAGFDMVEIHGGHGYLPLQFLSPNTNKRVDEFGGDLEQRAKFTIEVIKNIKEKCGKDYPVGLRISSDERLEDGLTMEDNMRVAPLFEEAGVDVFDVSTGAALTGHFIAGCMALKSGYNLSSAEMIKSVVNVPVMAVCKMNEPHLIETTIADKKADFVCIGRGSIADPLFPEKMKAGDIEDITPCMTCCQKCLPVPGVPNEIGMSCLANPFVGREQELQIKPVEKAKNIMVIGAGPSGLRFANIAAERGHKVTVYEKSNTIGGQFYLAAIPPTKQNISRLIKHDLHMCKKYGVEFKLGTEVTLDMIKEVNPDAVVIATGSTPLVPPIEGIKGDNVVTAHDILAGNAVAGKSVAILGGGSVGVETADFLAENTRQVSVIEMREDVAIDEPAYPRIFLMERLKKYGVQLYTGTKVSKISEHSVTCIKDDAECVIDEIDTFVLAFGIRQYNPFAEQLKDANFEVYSIGDAGKPGNAVDAIYSGAKLGVEI